jgi:hypothetical protein
MVDGRGGGVGERGGDEESGAVDDVRTTFGVGLLEGAGR